MLEWFAQTLRTYPEIAIFLSLALGYYFGSFTYKGLGLGAVTATLIAAVIIGLSAVACLGMGPAYPHDSKRPELNAWFKSLKNKVGEPCCDSGDGQHAVVEWDMARRGYKVLLKNPQRPDQSGQWFDVPYAVVIEQPNLSGVAMVWWWLLYDVSLHT